VPCKARSGIKQYQPKKRHRWGYKVWCLASAGYLCRFEIYSGRDPSPSPNGPLYDLVMRLTSSYFMRNHHLYIDGLFSSLPLYSTLLAQETQACGTIRINRVGFSESVVRKTKKLQRGEWCWRQAGQLTAYGWMDKKPVHLLSSIHFSDRTSTLDRRDKQHHLHTYTTPAALNDYNKYRADVDQRDQWESYYSISRKSKRWYPRLLWWLIDQAIINAYVLYDITQSTHTRHFQFRHDLARALMERYASSHAYKRKRRRTDQMSEGGQHWPRLSSSVGDCCHCSSRAQHRKRTKYICSCCRVHLCVSPCFEEYHIS
jgi:hypothetical protein